jgi:hypothetical protein
VFLIDFNNYYFKPSAFKYPEDILLNEFLTPKYVTTQHHNVDIHFKNQFFWLRFLFAVLLGQIKKMIFYFLGENRNYFHEYPSDTSSCPLIFNGIASISITE